ncbi:aminoglycoside phosphotransferase family protein [Streptomyces sp. NPDC056010]|uniref:aminoglycoside phosphotransferase family protein n=1 Tax=Streptomyces sp. NPDC056010 TaxID=3345679 RepID=UPI0035DF4B4B
MTDPQARADLAPELIRSLLRDQHPDLAELPLSLAARGWDNQLWRLGDGLAVRLPWATSSADELLLKEHAWVPGLAPGLPLPVPVPQRLGVPSERFPRPWLVTTWVPGEPGDRVPVTRGEDAADVLARFLSALHQVAPDGAPAGRGRGGPLGPYGEHFGRALGVVAERELFVDADGVRRVWDDAVAAPDWDGPALWLHGDLHPANVLTANGTFCGVIDFGDLFAGDPACDLAAAWILLPDNGVDRFYAAYDPAPDVATLRRARGWAVLRALSGLLIADDGDRGLPNGKSTWGPPARRSLERLVASLG